MPPLFRFRHPLLGVSGETLSGCQVWQSCPVLKLPHSDSHRRTCLRHTTGWKTRTRKEPATDTNCITVASGGSSGLSSEDESGEQTQTY